MTLKQRYVRRLVKQAEEMLEACGWKYTGIMDIWQFPGPPSIYCTMAQALRLEAGIA
jgi:hypothetical protein